MIILRQNVFSFKQKINETAAKRKYNLNDPDDRYSLRREFRSHPEAYSKEFKLKVLERDREWEEQQKKTVVDQKSGWRNSELSRIDKEIKDIKG